MTTVHSSKALQIRSAFLLFVAALIWGVAFVAQRVGMEYCEPFTFNAIRNYMGALVLLPCIALMDRWKAKEALHNEGSGDPAGTKMTSGTSMKPEGISEDPRRARSERYVLLRGGLVCGFFLAIAGNLQQVGIKYTAVGKAGFITAMYIVLVPLLGIFMKKKVGWRIWLSVALAVGGLYLLCMSGGHMTIERGDGYVLLSALAFAFQILAIDKYSRMTDGVRLACLEFAVCAVITTVLMLLFEHPTWTGIWAARLPLLYAGILSCAIAYTFQIIGQKGLAPAVASLLMSLESVISALAGWAILHQTLSGRELIGCAVMFAAILLAQL